VEWRLSSVARKGVRVVRNLAGAEVAKLHRAYRFEAGIELMLKL